MKIFSLIKGKKTRKYPVRYDEFGRSLRKRSFDLFDKGQRPMQVCKQLPIKVKTCLRYWADWKRIPPNLSQRYIFLRKTLKNNTGLKEDILESVAKYYHISRDEVIRRFRLPHGLKRLLLGKWPALWPDEEITEGEYKLRAALTLLDFAKTGDESYQDLNDVLNQLLARKRENRQSTQVDQTDDTDNGRYSEPMDRIQRRPRTRFDPRKIAPEERAVLEQYFTRKKEAEDLQAYNGIVGLMKIFGVSEEQANELLCQAVGQVHGPEKAADLRELIQKIQKPIASKNSDHLEPSTESGTT
jgi:hypothetical protein